MAEREGFEPPLGYYPKPTFQGSAVLLLKLNLLALEVPFYKPFE